MEHSKSEIINVIIPVYKPDETFHKLIEKLLRQTVPPAHIFLLQTIEEKGEPLLEVKEDIISVHPVLKQEFDHGATRDYGAKLAKASVEEKQADERDYLLFMTQDAMPEDEQLFEQLLVPFEDEKTGISYARQLPREGADIPERLAREHNYPAKDRIKTAADVESMGIQAYFCSDVCAMYRRDIYEELGGFVHPTIFNEDMIMAAHEIGAGYQVAYCAAARVIHSHAYTCMQQFHRNFDLGVSQRQYREIFDTVSSEKEGAGFAKNALLQLLKGGHPIKAFDFALQCGFKLFGYQLGKRYDKLPKSLVLKCTMSPGYVLFHQK